MEGTRPYKARSMSVNRKRPSTSTHLLVLLALRRSPGLLFRRRRLSFVRRGFYDDVIF